MALKKTLSKVGKMTAPLAASATILLSPNVKADEELAQTSVRQEEIIQ